MTDVESLRQSFLWSLTGDHPVHAARVAREILRQDAGIRQISFLQNAINRAPAEKLNLTPFKVALLSSFSIDLIHPYLIVYGFINGLRMQTYQSGFSQYRQEILNPQSGLFTSLPDAIVLAIEGKELVPSIYRNYLRVSEVERSSAITAAANEIEHLLTTIRERSTAEILLHNLFPPVWKQLGILDGHQSAGQAQLIHRLNEMLHAICRNVSGCHVVDYGGLVAQHGAAHWFDDRLAYYAKAPIASSVLGHLAREYMKYFRNIAGGTKKCLVLDLDNTLWGGVLGEDGRDGIRLGTEYPGSAYVAFQEAILDLHSRGVLLAVASKNNPDDVSEVFASHPHMVLRREHFADFRVGWGPKSESLKEIARNLNLGLEHMVFVDDSAAECEQVGNSLPSLTVLRLPNKPELFIGCILEDGLFDGLSLSAEDLRRSELYRQRDQAEVLQIQSGSLEDYYRSLKMEITFSPVDRRSLARAAQLTQKTNQFNATTIRFSEPDIAQRLRDPAWIITAVHVQDRFGDNGIVGLIMAHDNVGELTIDTFLLSCRVIGRTIETAMLAYLCELARQRGIRCLHGHVITTRKNAPVRDVFQRHGFMQADGPDRNTTKWSFDVCRQDIPYPEWIRVISPNTLATR
jgi:FkbH-like protein